MGTLLGENAMKTKIITAVLAVFFVFAPLVKAGDRDQPGSPIPWRQKESGKWGYIDKTRTFVIPAQFDEARDFFEGLASVRTGDKYGYIDKTGTFVIPAQFESASFFKEGLAGVRIDRKWGYIDKTGTFVIPAKFEYVYEFEEGLACVETRGKYGWIDKTGNFVIPALFDGVSLVPRFYEGLAVVAISSDAQPNRIEDAIGVDLATGKVKDVTFGVQIDSPYLQNVEPPLKYGYIDRHGQKVIECRFDDARGFQEGIASVKIRGKWGGIDKTGKLIIPSDFDEPFWFSDGLARVRISKKWGWIDRTGKFIIPSQFDDARDFDKTGIAWVMIGGKWGCIDKNGQSKDKPGRSKIEAIGDVYTVNPGDTLFYISVKAYGDGSKWKAILDANPELQGEPSNIRDGMKLKIPR
jgi:hypothetical protein